METLIAQTWPRITGPLLLDILRSLDSDQARQDFLPALLQHLQGQLKPAVAEKVLLLYEDLELRMEALYQLERRLKGLLTFSECCSIVALFAKEYERVHALRTLSAKLSPMTHEKAIELLLTWKSQTWRNDACKILRERFANLQQKDFSMLFDGITKDRVSAL